jgi:hypothetical protein
MERCQIEYRQIPGLGYRAWWCVVHDDDPAFYGPETDDWVCQRYVIGERKESRPQDAALRALEALSEALSEERQAHHYGHDYALVDGPLGAVKSAVDRVIRELQEEV